jgi:hypothetical protein
LHLKNIILSSDSQFCFALHFVASLQDPQTMQAKQADNKRRRDAGETVLNDEKMPKMPKVSFRA